MHQDERKNKSIFFLNKILKIILFIYLTFYNNFVQLFFNQRVEELFNSIQNAQGEGKSSLINELDKEILHS